MALTCTDCGIEHDLDEAPDIGTCVACGGDLVEDDQPRVDRAARMRELMTETIRNLAAARGVTPEAVMATMAAREYFKPGKAKGGAN
ncbi:MAG: hypothetical protein JO270_00085, partial [Acidobacteriaceae bacterium]|nr:hypothetical protein [Acidobacteriaceae bacterium]